MKSDSATAKSHKKQLKMLQTKLEKKVQELRLPATDPRALVWQRNKEMVAKCIHDIGIVVPYDKKTDVGYRPLPMSNSKPNY